MVNPLSLLGRELQAVGGGRSFLHLAFLNTKVHCGGRNSKGRYNLCSRLSVGERIAFKALCTTLWKSQRSLGEGDVNDRFVLLAGGQLRGMQCNIPLWSDSICPEIFTKIYMPKPRSCIVQTHHVTKEKQAQKWAMSWSESYRKVGTIIQFCCHPPPCSFHYILLQSFGDFNPSLPLMFWISVIDNTNHQTRNLGVIHDTSLSFSLYTLSISRS